MRAPSKHQLSTSMGAPPEHRLSGLTLARATWGLLLLAVPGRLIGMIPGAGSAGGTLAVARVLGVRHLAQASAAAAGSQLAGRAWGVDAVHAASMLALASAAPAHRRLAAADAVIAAAFALAARAAASR